MATPAPQPITDEEFNKFREIFRLGVRIFECEKVICSQRKCGGVNGYWSEAVWDMFALFDKKEVYLMNVKAVYNKQSGEVEFMYKMPSLLVSASSIPELINKLIERRYELLGSMLNAMFSDANWRLELTDKEIIDLLIDLSSVTFTKKYNLDDILAKLQKLHELYRWESQLLC